MKSWRVSWRNLMRKRGRTFLTIIAIIIGVASTVATISAAQSTQATITNYTEEIYGNVDYRILSQNNVFKDSWITKIKNTPGVTEAIGTLQGKMDIHELKGSNLSKNDKITASDNPVKVKSVSDLQSEILQLEIIEGSLTGDGIVIDKETSSIWNMNVGDQVVFDGGSKLHKIKISAIVANSPRLVNPDSWGSAAGKPWQVFIPLHIYQNWTANERSLQQIQILIDKGVEPSIMEERLNGTIASEKALFTQPVIVDENQIARGFDSLYNILYMIGGLSLIISVFILYNTLYISIVERRREFAVMKAVGYTPGQVRNQMLREVLILSLTGSIIGVIVGIGLSFGLVELVFSIFPDSPNYQVKLTQGVLIGFSTGLLIPLIAVLRPVYSASQIQVTTIFRGESVEEVSRFSSIRFIIGALLLVMGLLVNHSFAYLSLILGLALLFPFLFKGVAWVLYPISKLIFGREGKLAFRVMKRHNNRTAMTTAILTFGIILLVYISSLSIGVKESRTELTKQTLGGDISVDFEGNITDQQVNQLQSIPGVNEVGTFVSDSFIWELGDETRLLPISSVTQESIEKFPLFTYDQEKYDNLLQKVEEPNSIVLGSTAFNNWGGSIGEQVEFNTIDGQAKLEVVGVVDTMSGGYIGFTHEDTMKAVFSKTNPNHALLLTEDAATLRVKKAILTNEDLSVATVSTLPEEIEAMEQQMGNIFFMLNALVGIGIVVAGIGILNTLLMNIMERMREIGAMRALGITRRQLRKMMIVEAFFIGAIAAFVGVIFGILLMYVTSLQDIELLSSVPFVVSWSGVLGGIVFSIVVSMIACLIPSKQAVKIPVSDALKYD